MISLIPTNDIMLEAQRHNERLLYFASPQLISIITNRKNEKAMKFE